MSAEHGWKPLYYKIRDVTSDRFCFLDFVFSAIDAGYIGNGDILVLDNARVHTAGDIEPILLAALHVTI